MILRTIILILFRPDVLDRETSNITPDELLVSEAAKILDCPECDIVEHAGRHAGVFTNADDFFVTRTLPPMVRHWLRQNMPTLD